MDEARRLDLSHYRFERAKENVRASKELLASGYINISASRSYYAVFYALLAVTELDGFEAAKHSGIISYFNRNYVKKNIFAPDTYKLIDKAFKSRRYADYEGLYITTTEEAQEQISIAEKVIGMIEPYLQSRWAEMEAKQ